MILWGEGRSEIRAADRFHVSKNTIYNVVVRSKELSIKKMGMDRSKVSTEKRMITLLIYFLKPIFLKLPYKHGIMTNFPEYDRIVRRDTKTTRIKAIFESLISENDIKCQWCIVLYSLFVISFVITPFLSKTS